MYEINGVTYPDEYKENVDNNHYTNCHGTPFVRGRAFRR